MAYLLAGAVVLGAVGMSIGRQIQPQLAPSPPATIPATTTPAIPETPATTVTMASAPDPGGPLSEADLMAVPVDSVEMEAAALAEWYVVDFFTRDEAEGERSFVEWARAWEVVWETPTTARVTVLVRRLAATGGEAYRRLDAEAWSVVTELGDEGWAIVGGPVEADAPDLVVRRPDSQSTSEWTDAAGLVWEVAQAVEES